MYGPKKLWKIFRLHLDTLMYPFQPVVSDFAILENIRNKRYRWQNALPVLLHSAILLDTLMVLWNYGNDPANPMFFHHIIMKFVPIFFLDRASLTAPSLMLLIVLCFGNLFFDRCPHLPFILYQPDVKNRPDKMIFPYRKKALRNISRSLGGKIAKFYTRWKRNIRLVCNFLIFELNIAFSIPLAGLEFYKIYTTSGSYFPRLRYIVTMLVVPFFFTYLCTTTQIGIQFMTQMRIIQIKQGHYSTRMDMDETELLETEPVGKALHFRKCYNKCIQTMTKVLDLAREINTFNKFYTTNITIMLVTFIFVGCTLTQTGLVGLGQAPFLFILVWLVFGQFYFFCLLFFSATSSRCNLLNLLLFKKLRQTQIKLLASRLLTRHQIIKLDLVNEYKLFLQKCSFRLVNSAMINNKLFAYQIFGCVSVVYMRLMSHKSSGSLLSID